MCFISNKRFKFVFIILSCLIFGQQVLAQETNTDASSNVDGTGVIIEKTEDGESITPSIFDQALDSGPVVFVVLLILVLMSVAVWGIVAAKWLFLNKLVGAGEVFIDKFWESRSLNDLNLKIGDFENCPQKEMFKKGYAELVKSNQLKSQMGANELFIKASMENLNRTLHKSRTSEREKLEKFVPMLAISASAAPFIGLFGTVWGIMRAFEGIAQRGDASLSAVAPGISEALVATAFGLAAAIPAAIGYNIFAVKIKKLLSSMDGFTSDFLNIVERYLVTESIKAGKSKPQQ